MIYVKVAYKIPTNFNIHNEQYNQASPAMLIIFPLSFIG